MIAICKQTLRMSNPNDSVSGTIPFVCVCCLVRYVFGLVSGSGLLKQKNVTAPHNPINLNIIQKNICCQSHGLRNSTPFKCITLPHMFFLPKLLSQHTRQPNYCHLKLICLTLNWYAMLNTFLLSRVQVFYLLCSLLNWSAAAMSFINIHHHFFPIYGCFFQVGLF